MDSCVDEILGIWQVTDNRADGQFYEFSRDGSGIVRMDFLLPLLRSARQGF